MRQYDHHCIIVFMGWAWRINKAGKHKLWVRRDVDEVATVATCIDTSHVDWQSYSEAAVALDYEGLNTPDK